MAKRVAVAEPLPLVLQESWMAGASTESAAVRPLVAVIWIDWYPYHVARFQGLLDTPGLYGRLVGLELVGGVGVHAGLRFREGLPAGLPVETLMPETAWRDAGQWRLARLLWRRLAELDPEVVLVPGYYTLPGVAAAVWARLHGAASVLMTESTEFDHPRVWWKERVKAAVLHVLFGWAVAGGKAHVRYLETLGFPARRVGKAYDVVDNRRIREGTTALRETGSGRDHGLPAGPYFLFVGRLSPEKNVAGLVRAWTRYREQGGTWPLVLAGDGPERSRLETLAGDSGVGQDVHFAGLCQLEALLPLYSFAGCFVLPSTLEPWGLVVNEAMAAALPVLVSNRCGCAADLLEPGGNGFTFDPHDEAALCALMQKMERLLPDERARMGEESSRIIERYRPEDFGQSVEAIVRAAAAGRTELVEVEAG